MIPEIQHSRADQGVLVVAPQGPLDLGLVTSLWRAVHKCLAEEPAGIVVDLTRAALQPTSSAALMSLGRLIAEHPVTSFGICGSPELLHSLDFHGVRRVCSLWATVEEAVDHARDPARRRRIKRLIASSAQAPARARQLLLEACRGWPVDAAAVTAAAMVMSELVTNAVVHAGGDLQVGIELAGQVLVVTVRDRSPVLPRRRRPYSGLEKGRGLAIVAQLSQSWGSVPVADDGKVVWARIPATDGDESSGRRPRAGRGRRR